MSTLADRAADVHSALRDRAADVHSALRDRAAELDRLRPKPQRAGVIATPDTQEWTAICDDPDCGWLATGFSSLDHAEVRGKAHTAAPASKGHTVHYRGVIVVIAR